MRNTLLRNAIRRGLSLHGVAGVTLALGAVAGPALAQDDTTSQQLETITVTGSNIRRVDIETANPVITLDRAEIQKSGKLTVGDLLQQLPTVAGAAMNPNVNNGGGVGAAVVDLRGLGSNRTLILVDGRRAINNDINALPASAIERVEVLTSGASAVYGSDAIAGVVNFIMRKDYQGAELALNYGVTDKDDGARSGATFTFGHTSDRGSLFGGIDYNQMDPILAGHRDFALYALTFNPDGSVIRGGSFTGPGGFFANVAEFADCAYYGYGTADPSAPGGNGIPPGFRCYVGSSQDPDQNDNFNYAPINLITTPQERANFFLNGNYRISDSAEIYAQVFHNTTRSAAQLAPAPISMAGTGITMSADNPYNPFGVDIGAGADGDFGVRLTALGPRYAAFRSVTDQGRFGVRGNLFDTDWQYDVWTNYGHQWFEFTSQNYFNAALTGTALSGDCVMPDEGPLSTTTCLNIFNQADPITQQLMRQFYSLSVDNGGNARERQGGFDMNGSLFELPGGTAQLAVGANYRKFELVQFADTAIITDPATGDCGSLPELCTSPYSGGYDVKEAYAEAFVPLLKDIPFMHSLNLILGDRYSDYSSFGSTNNWKIALEYRPIEDLLLRGTVSQVFRAPNTGELFTGQSSSFDPYTPGPNQPRSFNNDQIQTIFSGAAVSGYPIKPENGKSFNFGAVYDPQWLDGLSISADYWRVYLLNNITRPVGQTIVDFCYAGGAYDPDNPYCQAITFTSTGSILSLSGPYTSVQNLGRLDASGVDIAINYRLPELAFGNFNVGLNATYLSEYDNQVPGAPRDSVAGTFNAQYGNFPRWRALGSIGWQLGDFSANWQVRYLGRLKNTAPAFADYGDGFLPIGSVTYHNISFGYNIEPINTRIDLGVDNVGDKQPPLFYQSTTNANIDINTYDPIGRYYFGRVTVKF